QAAGRGRAWRRLAVGGPPFYLWMSGAADGLGCPGARISAGRVPLRGGDGVRSLLELTGSCGFRMAGPLVSVGDDDVAGFGRTRATARWGRTGEAAIHG